MLYNQTVAVVHKPEVTNYPAFPFSKSPDNNVYRMVEQLFMGMKLDLKHAQSSRWNPLGDIIQPGQTVLIKPNWVRDFNPIDSNIDSLVTHTAVIRPVIDYVIKAMKGKGRLVLADAPLQNCNFDNLMEQNQVGELVAQYAREHKGIAFEVIDLRKTVLKRLSTLEQIKAKQHQFDASGDPNGYSLVDLGDDSLLTDIKDRFERFRVTNYNHHLLHEHHNETKQEYLVANAILSADVIINMPKMKTHIKAGVTGALKNLIGINGHKEYLPHHINGSFFEGGDQYMYKSRIKDLYNKIYDVYWSEHRQQTYLVNKLRSLTIVFLALLNKIVGKENLYDGGWFGNETIPRTTIDLNHILNFFDYKEQKFKQNPVRTVLHIVDGIVAGQNDGPLRPQAKPVGVLIGGFNPLYVDLVMAQLIGYHPLGIKTIFYGLYHKKSRLTQGVISNTQEFAVILNDKDQPLGTLPNLGFIIPRYWRAVAKQS